MCENRPISRFSVAATISGNKQYPSRHILWKKEIVPPSSCPLIAITAAPSQTMMKTISKSNVLSSAWVLELRTLKASDTKTYDARIKQKKKGPQRSQLRISLRFCSLSVYANGFITIRSFSQMRTRSRFFWVSLQKDLRLCPLLARLMCSYSPCGRLSWLVENRDCWSWLLRPFQTRDL